MKDWDDLVELIGGAFLLAVFVVSTFAMRTSTSSIQVTSALNANRPELSSAAALPSNVGMKAPEAKVKEEARPRP